MTKYFYSSPATVMPRMNKYVIITSLYIDRW